MVPPSANGANGSGRTRHVARWTGPLPVRRVLARSKAILVCVEMLCIALEDKIRCTDMVEPLNQTFAQASNLTQPERVSVCFRARRR